MVGRPDRVVPPQFAQLLRQYNSQLQVIELDHVGHCPHDEHPEIVNQAIADWRNRFSSVLNHCNKYIKN